MESVAKARWAAGLPNELEHWGWWLGSGQGAPPEATAAEYEARLNPDADLQPGLVELLSPHAPPGSTVSILDVGAGPLTVVGKKWLGRTLAITAIDPLAPEYDRLLEAAGVVPPVRSRYGEVEQLLTAFPPDHFDLVTCCNALDHVYDPVRGLRQMLSVVKPARSVVMLHNADEGERQAYHGLHQWNFRAEDGELIVWNREARWSVNRELGAAAFVRLDLTSFPGLLLAYLTKNRPGAV